MFIMVWWVIVFNCWLDLIIYSLSNNSFHSKIVMIQSFCLFPNRYNFSLVIFVCFSGSPPNGLLSLFPNKSKDRKWYIYLGLVCYRIHNVAYTCLYCKAKMRNTGNRNHLVGRSLLKRKWRTDGRHSTQSQPEIAVSQPSARTAVRQRAEGI